MKLKIFVSHLHDGRQRFEVIITAEQGDRVVRSRAFGWTPEAAEETAEVALAAELLRGMDDDA